MGTIYLGIEGGGTHTRVRAESAAGDCAADFSLGPANLRLLTDAGLRGLLRTIARQVPPPKAIAIGLAGMRTATDRRRVENAVNRIWPKVPCLVTNDLETALAAGQASSRGRSPEAVARVLILSGTGSCCYGKARDGQTAKLGGWGHLLGDKGSGYEIGLRALKAVVYYFDRDGEWSTLGRQILRVLQLNEPNDLIGWVQSASKMEIAALAKEVFQAWSKRDAIATDILRGAMASLARDGADCARRLAKPGQPVQFVLAGSLLLKQPRFAAGVTRHLRRFWPRATVTPIPEESVLGAVQLARSVDASPASPEPAEARPIVPPLPLRKTASPLSTTEQRNPRSLHLDKLSIAAAVDLMVREEQWVNRAVAAEQKTIVRVIGWIVRSFRSRGRLFYVGAGTSGRLGVLDASECPPTFRTPPEWVQGIIAGGQRALWAAAEGAEDDAEAGGRAVAFRGVGPRDVVVGIAASGRTPYVWGALRAARSRRAKTVLLCCNPALALPRTDRVDALIALPVGPEILTGSTRLKAGTATKLVLNLFTTIAMVKLGKVRSNLMIDVNASNAKLRDRAIRITRELTGADDTAIRTALERTRWQIAKACQLLAGARR